MKTERELMGHIEKRLELYQFTGEVEFWLRLNAGRVKTYYGSYLRLAPKSTPDYIAVIRNRQEGLTVLFLEAKSDTGRLRQGQEEFRDKYNKKSGFYVMEIREIKQLEDWIEKYGKDFVSFMPDTL